MEAEIKFTDGSTVRFYDRNIESPADLIEFIDDELNGKPGWLQLGNVVCFTQNIVHVRFIEGEDDPTRPGGSE